MSELLGIFAALPSSVANLLLKGGCSFYIFCFILTLSARIHLFSVAGIWRDQKWHVSYYVPVGHPSSLVSGRGRVVRLWAWQMCRANVCFGTGAAVVLGCKGFVSGVGRQFPLLSQLGALAYPFLFNCCWPLTLKCLCVSCLVLTCNWLILCEQLKQQCEFSTLQIPSQKPVEWGFWSQTEVVLVQELYFLFHAK